MIPWRHRAMGRAVAGKPPKGWAERQRRLRRKKERRMRMLRGDGGAGAEDRAEGVPVAAEATPVFGAYGQDGASSSGAGQAHADCDGDDYYQQYEGYDGEYEGFYYDPSYEPSSDEEVGADAGSDLALDVAHQFLFGPEWRADILAFLSERAHVFAVRDGGEGTSGAQDDFSQSQHEAFCSFRVFAERRLDALLSSMGLTSAALAARCRRVLRTEGSERRDAAVMVVQSLLAVDDFGAFARLCIDFAGRNPVPASGSASSAGGASGDRNGAQEASTNINMSDRTITFSRPGPLGLELAPRISGGGAIVKDVVLESAADQAGVCRGFVVVKIAGANVEREPLSDIVTMLISTPRPVEVVFQRHAGKKNRGGRAAAPPPNDSYESKRERVSEDGRQQQLLLQLRQKEEEEEQQQQQRRRQPEIHPHLQQHQLQHQEQSSGSHSSSDAAPSMSPLQMRHMLDLPTDWSTQIEIARRLCSSGVQLDDNERQELLPWAEKALQLERCRQGYERCGAERLLELRADVFRARIRMDVHVARKMVGSSGVVRGEGKSTADGDLAVSLSRSQDLESAIERQRALVLKEVDKLGMSEAKYGSVYFLLKTMISGGGASTNLNGGAIDGAEADLDAIPQACEGMIALLIKLLCLEQERDDLQMSIRRAVSGTAETSGAAGAAAKEGDQGRYQATRIVSQSDGAVDAVDESDCFLHSIRFLKGDLGVSPLKLEQTSESKTSLSEFEESMLQSHFL